MVVRVLVVYPFDHVPHWELPSITREYVLPITSMGQDQNSKFHIQFLLNAYGSYTIVK